MTAATPSSLSLILSDDKDDMTRTRNTNNNKPPPHQDPNDDDDQSVDLFHDCSESPVEAPLPPTSKKPKKPKTRAASMSHQSVTTYTSTTSSSRRNHMSLSNLSSTSLVGMGGFLNKTKSKLGATTATYTNNNNKKKHKVRSNKTNNITEWSASDSRLNGGRAVVVGDWQGRVAAAKSSQQEYANLQPENNNNNNSLATATSTTKKTPNHTAAPTPEHDYVSVPVDFISAGPAAGIVPSNHPSWAMPPLSGSKHQHNQSKSKHHKHKHRHSKKVAKAVDHHSSMPDLHYHQDVSEVSASSFLSEVMAYAEEHHAMDFSWVAANDDEPEAEEQQDISERLAEDLVAMEEEQAPPIHGRNKHKTWSSPEAAPRRVKKNVPSLPAVPSHVDDHVKPEHHYSVKKDEHSAPQQETFVVGTVPTLPLAVSSSGDKSPPPQPQPPLVDSMAKMKATLGLNTVVEVATREGQAHDNSDEMESSEKRRLRVLEHHAMTSSPAAQRFAHKVEAARDKIQQATHDARERMAMERSNHEQHHHNHHHRHHHQVANAVAEQVKPPRHERTPESKTVAQQTDIMDRSQTTADGTHRAVPRSAPVVREEAKPEPQTLSLPPRGKDRQSPPKSEQGGEKVETSETEQPPSIHDDELVANMTDTSSEIKLKPRVDAPVVTMEEMDHSPGDNKEYYEVLDADAMEEARELEYAAGIYDSVPLAPGELEDDDVDDGVEPYYGTDTEEYGEENASETSLEPMQRPQEETAFSDDEPLPVDTFVLDRPARPMTPLLPTPLEAVVKKPTPVTDAPPKVKSTLRKRDGSAVTAFEMAVQAISESTNARDGKTSKSSKGRDRMRNESSKSKHRVRARKGAAKGGDGARDRTYSMDSTLGKTGVRKVPAMITANIFDDEIASTDMTKPASNKNQQLKSKAPNPVDPSGRKISPLRPPAKSADSTSMTSNTRSTISSSFSAELATAASAAAAASESTDNRRRMSLPTMSSDGDKTPPRRASYAAPRRGSNDERRSGKSSQLRRRIMTDGSGSVPGRSRSSQPQMRRRSMTEGSVGDQSTPSVYKMVENYFPMSPGVKRTTLVVPGGGRRRSSSVKTQAMNLRGSHTVMVGGMFNKKK